MGHFRTNGNKGIHITQTDYVRTPCYNNQLVVVQSAESVSTDTELQALLGTQLSPVVWREEYHNEGTKVHNPRCYILLCIVI